MDPIEAFTRYLREANPCARVVTAATDNALEATLQDERPAFVGCAPDRRTLVAVIDSSGAAPCEPAPSDFRVVAIVPVYNEEDLIARTLRDLIRQGMEVCLIDNWSTDRTLERVAPFVGRGVRSVERFPGSAPSDSYDLRALMHRVESVAASLQDADWIVLHDADERRRPPWPGVTMRDALWHVDRHGYTCVDHVTLNFWPIDDGGFDPDGCDIEDQLRFFEFSSHAGHFHQRRAWKQVHQRVNLRDTGGHDVRFTGRRVYPYKFLLKHYPVRSQHHGERKVLVERLARWNESERAMGWHCQYDGLCATRRFTRRPEDLLEWDERDFYARYMIERLSGAGVFETPPAWATSPRW